MIEPHCFCRIFASEMESSNYYKPQAPCEIADIKRVFQETIHSIENLTLMYTKPRRFLNLKHACLLNIHYIKNQTRMNNDFLSSYKFEKEINGEYAQKSDFDMKYLVDYLSGIWINVDNATNILKLKMRLQYTFVVVNQEKQIPSGLTDYIVVFTAILRFSTWYSAVIVIPDRYYFRNITQDTVDNINTSLCVPHRTDDPNKSYACETASHLNLQVILGLRNKNFIPTCLFTMDKKSIDLFSSVVNRRQKVGFKQNTLFEFLAFSRGKDGESTYFTQRAARVDLWQEISEPKPIDTYMAAEICSKLNYSINPDTFAEPFNYIVINPPVMYASFSGETIHLMENIDDNGNLAAVQHDEYRALSCYRVPTLSFMIYTIPFNLNLWIILPVTFIIVLKILQVYTKATFRNAISFCLFFYSSLVNNCTNIPAVLSKSEILRLIWIPWIFMCIIVNNCYVSILVSHINVPHSGQPITNISQVLCANNDGIETFEGFTAPFEITNETLAFKNLLHITEITNRQWKETKRNYNKAINFWKPTSQYSRLRVISLLQGGLQAGQVMQLVKQYARSGGEGYLKKLKSYQTDDSCFSLLSPPALPGLDTLNPSPFGYELMEAVLNGLIHSELDQENYLAKFIQPKQRHYPKFSNILDKPVANYTDKVYYKRFVAREILIKKYQPFVKEAAVEDELTECGKSIYISTMESVKDELDYLMENYPTLSFYAPKNSLFKTVTGWRFPTIQMELSKLPTLIQAYHGETGIYKHLGKQIRMSSLIHRRNYTLIINKAKRVSAIKLSKPLQTVFIIIIVGLTSALIIFGIEIIICPSIPLYLFKFHRLFFLNL